MKIKRQLINLLKKYVIKKSAIADFLYDFSFKMIKLMLNDLSCIPFKRSNFLFKILI